MHAAISYIESVPSPGISGEDGLDFSQFTLVTDNSEQAQMVEVGLPPFEMATPEDRRAYRLGVWKVINNATFITESVVVSVLIGETAQSTENPLYLGFLALSLPAGAVSTCLFAIGAAEIKHLRSKYNHSW